MRLNTTNAGTRLASAALLAAVLAGCEARTLAVKTPDVVSVQSTQGAGSLPVLSASIIANFTFAYAGDGGNVNEGVIQDGALLGDEYISSDTYPTRNEIDQRIPQYSNANSNTVFADINIFRKNAEDAVAAYQAYQPGVSQEAEAYTWAGYSYILIAETYCTGIPFSFVNNNTGAITFGPLESTAQMWHDARVRFDSALAVLAADTVTADQGNIAGEVNFASIGKGRALLDSGDAVDAAAAVAAVPLSYNYFVATSTNTERQWNGVWTYDNNERRYSIPDNEGINGLSYRSNGTELGVGCAGTMVAGDPRITWYDNGAGFNTAAENYAECIFPSVSSNISVATGVEAQLIIAEADLQGGNTGAAKMIINNIRSTVFGDTSTFVFPGNPDSAVTALFKERAYDLWLTAHRLGDLRRLIRQYGFAPDAVFPTGAYQFGGSYGESVSLPLPSTEASNPNFKICDTTVP
jgi:starch-binding outer membrane protein, SusD/RagB family